MPFPGSLPFTTRTGSRCKSPMPPNPHSVSPSTLSSLIAPSIRKTFRRCQSSIRCTGSRTSTKVEIWSRRTSFRLSNYSVTQALLHLYYTITHLSRLAFAENIETRLYSGPQNIVAALKDLPTSEHPISESEKFVVDAWAQPGLLAGNAVGLFVTVHGQFFEGAPTVSLHIRVSSRQLMLGIRAGARSSIF